MRLPDKVIAYSNSALSRFPEILGCLFAQPLALQELYERTSDSFTDIGAFIETLDCLYALGRIEYDEKTEVLRYVD
jgi:hypothetical protein